MDYRVEWRRMGGTRSVDAPASLVNIEADIPSQLSLVRKIPLWAEREKQKPEVCASACFQVCPSLSMNFHASGTPLISIYSEYFAEADR